MKLLGKCRVIQGLTVWFLIAGFLCSISLRVAAQGRMGQDVQTIRGFEVPEFDRENRLQSRLFGDFARILPSGMVDITGMRIDFYDENREVEMRVTAEQCLYDRDTRHASSDTRIRIARENMIITGKGFVWDAEEERFEIHEDVKVVFRELHRVFEEGVDE